jgi:O-6-methylguanine DNA methyltransferase
MKISYVIFSSPLGELLVAGNAQGITHVSCDADGFIASQCDYEQAEAGSIVANAAATIRSYLKGAITTFSIPLITEGTAFQKNVWAALRQIPYGQTTSYSRIAEKLNKPTAFRAVANACGQNPVPILIPCHRVVHKNGNVSGFAWGVEAKKMLLAIEAAQQPLALAA